MLSNDGDALFGAARAGAGIASAMEVQVEDDFSTGRLIPLLEP